MVEHVCFFLDIKSGYCISTNYEVHQNSGKINNRFFSKVQLLRKDLDKVLLYLEPKNRFVQFIYNIITSSCATLFHSNAGILWNHPLDLHY